MTTNHPLFSIEYTKYEHEYIMPDVHCHNTYELYILEQGHHSILINDSIHDINSYDVVLFKPNIVHKSLEKQDYARTCIYFTDRFLRLHFTEHSIKVLLNCFDKEVISLNKETFPRMKKLISLLEQEDITANENRVFVYLADILNILNTNKTSPKSEQFPPVHKNLAPILSYINKNYNTITNIEEISEQFYISKYYLCRKFKETTGLTLIQYLTNIKLQNACNMLINTDLSVSDIGLACGFNSTMYFCKIFKQALSLTPSEFRKNTS